MKNRQTVSTAMQESDFLRSPWWIGLGILFILSLLFPIKFAFAEISDSGNLKFDHSKTGFLLTGSHVQARCASCHVNGVFKGTPRDCSSCHVAGNHMGAQAKTTKHIATVAQCDSCHQNTTWIPATFRHVGLPDGTCQTCHNGTAATGKPTGHIATTDSCDTCHKTVDWKQLAAGGMPANHLPTTQPCSTCHKQASLVPGTMSHSGIMSGCTSCHNGQRFTGVTPKSKPTNHLPTNMPCETCHSSTNFMSFLLPTSPSMMSHAGIVNGCTTCHNGQAFVGVTPKSKLDASAHMATSLDCSSCHTSTATFKVANLTTPPVGHLPTTQVCSSCHTAGYGSGSGLMSHAGIVSGCTSCHNGQVFTGVTPKSKPVNHLPTSGACENCHKPTNFSTGGGGFGGFGTATTMNHVGLVGGCTSCHNGQSFFGVTPASKLAAPNHVPTTMSCETCHSSTVWFSGAAMNHAGIVGSCKTCHNGQSFFGVVPLFKASSSTHNTLNADCSTCHTSTATFSTMAGAVLPANHLPTTQTCSTCHTSFGSGSGKMSHVGIGSGCTTCHNGQTFAVGMTPKSKPTNHVPTSSSCEICHTTANTSPGGFAGGAMKHTGIVGGCTNCHNGQAFAGVTPLAKPINHLPTTMACETCHSTTAFTTFSGTLMKHTGIVSNCASCHNGQTFAVGMIPVSKASYPLHLVTTADCSTCHSSTVTFLVASGGSFPPNHLPTTQSCSICHTSFGPGSGVMKHVGIGSGCTTCHNGQTFAVGMTPKSKPTNHLPTSASCETCHTTAITTTGGFAGGVMNHVGIVGGCTNCHNGQAFAGITPVTKSARHIPYAANLTGGAGMGCEFCHSKTIFTTFTTGLVSSTTMHNGTMGNGAGWCKGCHLSGLSWSAPLTTKSLTHDSTTVNGVPVTDCSQSGCHRPLGNTGTAYTNWN